MEKKYTIQYGTAVFYTGDKSIVPSEYLDDIQINDSKIIAEFGNEDDARKEFQKYHCDCHMAQTLTRIQCDCELYFLSIENGEYNEVGEWEGYDVEIEYSPFYLETYMIN